MMTKTTSHTIDTIDTIVRCKPFSAFPMAEYSVRVDADDSVRVWDDIAGHYTRCHSLSVASQRRIARKTRGTAAAEAMQDESTQSHTYTIWTDAENQEITATSLDEAVAIFADDASITTWDDLVAHVREIGDGAWVRADSKTDRACVALCFDSSEEN